MGVKKNFFLCFILSPIGAACILMNRGAIQKRDFILYLLFAAINIYLWLSLMIFDRSMWKVVGNRKCGSFVLRIQIDRREAL
ncbi:hypothetical protein ABE51_25835 [Bacillus thuringiensis]|nr:hypothetical protein [Bacillus thuringiensis]MBG9617828.1 hypothetical protein [Bacillus cereus]